MEPIKTLAQPNSGLKNSSDNSSSTAGLALVTDQQTVKRFNNFHAATEKLQAALGQDPISIPALIKALNDAQTAFMLLGGVDKSDEQVGSMYETALSVHTATTGLARAIIEKSNGQSGVKSTSQPLKAGEEPDTEEPKKKSWFDDFDGIIDPEAKDFDERVDILGILSKYYSGSLNWQQVLQAMMQADPGKSGKIKVEFREILTKLSELLDAFGRGGGKILATGMSEEKAKEFAAEHELPDSCIIKTGTDKDGNAVYKVVDRGGILETGMTDEQAREFAAKFKLPASCIIKEGYDKDHKAIYKVVVDIKPLEHLFDTVEKIADQHPDGLIDTADRGLILTAVDSAFKSIEATQQGANQMTVNAREQLNSLFKFLTSSLSAILECLSGVAKNL